MNCIRRAHAVWTTCTCPPCAKDRRRMAKLARNGKVTRVPNDIAWAAFKRMADQGWSGRAIASATGISEASAESALTRLSKGHVQKFGPRTAAAIIAATTPTDGMVGSHGARRRLRGLARLGWTLEEISAATGIGFSTLAEIRRGRTQTVHAHMHNTIAEYARTIGLKVGPSRPARLTAERKQWAPLLAWDDIDDPNAKPHIGADPHGTDVDDIVWLVRCGGTWDSISARLGIGKDAIDHALRRHGRTDVIAELARGGSRNQWNGEVAS